MAGVLRGVGLSRIAADALGAGGVFLALTAHRDAGAACIAAAMVIICVHAARAMRRAAPASAIGPLGTWVLPRTLVAVGLAVIVSGWHTGGFVASVAATAAILAETAVEPVARLAVPYAVNLPGVSVRNDPLLRPRWIFAVNTAGLALLTVGVLSGHSGSVTTVIPAILWCVMAIVTTDVTERILARRRAARRLSASIAEYAPTFMVHWYAPFGSKHQITMWLPYLERLGRPFMIVVRNPATFAEIAAETNRPVILRRFGPELSPVVVPTLRTVFYVNTSPQNEPMLAFLQLQQVQLNHGDSDKAPSFRRMLRVYDKNFVAGQAAVDRFARHGVDVPASQFEIVGRPQVEAITVADIPVGRHQAPTVLYAPTWYGYLDDSRHSSLPIGERIVRALLERGCTVIFRPHPWTRRTPELAEHAARIDQVLRDDATRTDLNHRLSGEATEHLSLVDCFNQAHAMIADVSSVMSDFLYSEKPYALTVMNVDQSDVDLVREFPLARGGYLLSADGTDWPRRLDDLLKFDPKLLERRSLRSYYLGPFPADCYADAFVATAIRYV